MKTLLQEAEEYAQVNEIHAAGMPEDFLLKKAFVDGAQHQCVKADERLGERLDPIAEDIIEARKKLADALKLIVELKKEDNSFIKDADLRLAPYTTYEGTPKLGSIDLMWGIVGANILYMVTFACLKSTGIFHVSWAWIFGLTGLLAGLAVVLAATYAICEYIWNIPGIYRDDEDYKKRDNT